MPHTREIDYDERALSEAGFDPAAEPEDALKSLLAMRGRPDVSATAIARALGGVKSSGAAEALQQMESASSGALRREIRRSLFRLRQSGIEPSAPPPAEAVPAAASEPEIDAMLSPSDSSGVRLVWIVKPRPRGGTSRLWGFTSDDEGLVECSIGPATRRQIKRDRAMVEARTGVKLVEADWRLCDFILCEAYRNTPGNKRVSVGNFLTQRAEIIASPPPENFVHPIYAEFAAESAEEPSLDLLKEPEMTAWHFPPARLKPWLDEIAEIRNSTLVVSQVQNEQRINSVIDKAVAELLDRDNANRTRRRFEDLAYYLARGGRRKAAGWAAAAALRVRDGTDLSRVPLFHNVVRTALGAMLAEEQEKEREEPRLIMTPAEAMRARQASARRR
ncbi:MAG: hypothetical protein ACREP6_14025 [Candidatus Binataceae bacterium]